MTPPPAATVAGRRVQRESAIQYVPRVPRRVSGAGRPPDPGPEQRPRGRASARPSTRPSGRATAAAAALEAALAPSPTRPRREAPAPGRIRREAPTRSRSGARRRSRGHQAPRLALRLQAPRLDRIVRGRAWIPVLGVLLIAIVGLRVEVLKLGSSVGSEIQQATALQSADAALRARISALSDNQRIATLAGAYGMRMPNPLGVHFVQTSVGSHVPAAIRNISAPSGSTFLTGLAAEQRANEQSNQAVAAMNGAATNTGANTAANGNVSAGTTSTAAATTSTATGSVSNTTPPTTGVQPTAGVTSNTGISDTNSAGTTPPASTAGGAASVGGTAGVSAASNPATSQTTLPTGSTDGGSGLAG